MSGARGRPSCRFRFGDRLIGNRWMDDPLTVSYSPPVSLLGLILFPSHNTRGARLLSRFPRYRRDTDPDPALHTALKGRVTATSTGTRARVHTGLAGAPLACSGERGEGDSVQHRGAGGPGPIWTPAGPAAPPTRLPEIRSGPELEVTALVLRRVALCEAGCLMQSVR